MYVHIDYGCGFLPERREVVERAVHVVEARRRLARECVERPVHRRERGRGDFRGLCVELNLSHAPRQLRGECSFSSFPGFAVWYSSSVPFRRAKLWVFDVQMASPAPRGVAEKGQGVHPREKEPGRPR